MDSNAPDTPLTQQPSRLAERLKLELLQSTNASQNASQNYSPPGSPSGSVVAPSEQRDFLMRFLPDVPNMAALVRTDIETRMHTTRLEKFVNPDSLIYPFEVSVTLELPKPNDFMWNFKHSFFLSIMYSQVYRYFFPFNRHNSQLFFITNESHSDDYITCMNIPSRIMFRSMNLDTPLENICIAAISAYKDYMAFFRLSSKQQSCLDEYKNFTYVPPVWTNRLE